MNNGTGAPFADLHTHTTCSDGILTPEQLVELAERRQVQVLSITDHDTLDAHMTLAQGGYNGPVSVIVGIEMSCFEHGRDVHILGYGVDVANVQLQEFIAAYRIERQERAELMLAKIRTLGFHVTMDEVLIQANGAPIGRPHLAAVMVQRGFASTIQQAFNRWFETGGPGYVAKNERSVAGAVNLIRQAGGIAVVAHPGTSFTEPRRLLGLVSSGIDGIEVIHPSHWPSTREFYRVIAKQHALVMTGGSDFHGSRHYDDANFGNVGATREMVEALTARIALRRSILHKDEQPRT